MDVSEFELDLETGLAVESGEAMSSPNGPGGKELISAVVSATGLPGKMIQQELEQIVVNGGHAPADVTLEGLRAALVLYLDSLGPDFLLDLPEDQLPQA